MKVLFAGGPLDGEVKDVKDGMGYIHTEASWWPDPWIHPYWRVGVVVNADGRFVLMEYMPGLDGVEAASS